MRTRTRVGGVWVDLPPGPPGPAGVGPTGPSGSGGILTAYISGLLVVGTGSMFLYNDTGSTVTIESVRVSLNTPPGGGPAKFDINLNGTTIFTDQTHRPQIAAGVLTSGLVVPDVIVWPAGQKLTADVDLIGTSYAGANATLQIGLV